MNLDDQILLLTNRLAAVPVLGEQVKEDLLLGMLANHLFVEFHTQPRPLREHKVPILHFWVAGSLGFHPILGKVTMS